MAVLLLPGPVWAVEAVPALTDREIVERLTRLETGQTAVRAEVGQLREDMNRQTQQLRAEMGQLRGDMNRQTQQLRAEMGQLREDMNLQFARQFRLTVALLGAFAALVAAIIGFALWDRRTMLRPFERSVRSL